MLHVDNPICFHIGYPRTGTTFLRRVVFPRYRDKAVLCLPQNEALAFLREFFLDSAQYAQGEHYLKERLHLYLNSFPSLRSKPIIVSSEAFIGSGYQDNYYLAKRIHNIFPESKIIVCIRSQLTMLPSLYALYIKSGGVLKYDTYATKIMENDKLNYYKFIKIYHDFFSARSVLVLFYEELYKNQDAFIKKILDFFHLPWTDAFKQENQLRNPRYPEMTQQALRIINKISLLGFKEQSFFLNSFKKFILHAGYKMNKHNFALTSKLFKGIEKNDYINEQIRNHYARSNRLLFDLLSKPLIKQSYPM